MDSQALDIGEQSLSKLVEAAISAQLDNSDSLHVEVRTDPAKLAQGQIDSLIVTGKGIVAQNDLRTAELTLEAGSVDISMLKMLTGEFALDKPADAVGCIVLKPKDIQTAFNGDYIKQKMRGQKITLDTGETVTTDINNVVFTIPEAGRIALEADILLIEEATLEHVAFSANPRLVADGYSIALEGIKIDDAANERPALTRTLVDTTQELLNFQSFDLGNMTLQFTQLDVQSDAVVFTAKAKIESFN